jgi:hypothetical protein
MRQTKQNSSAGGTGARKIVRLTPANASEIKPSPTYFQAFYVSCPFAIHVPERHTGSLPFQKWEASMSKIVALNRTFRSRLEVEHRQSTSSEDWVFSFEHFGDQGRRSLGTWIGDEASGVERLASTLIDRSRLLVENEVRP